MFMNLLPWLPRLNDEDKEAIAYAVRIYGCPRRLTAQEGYRDGYRAAAKSDALPFLPHKLVIDALGKASAAYGAAARRALEKLETLGTVRDG